MEQRNIIKWSEYSEYTELTIPSGEIWMSEPELVDFVRSVHPQTEKRHQSPLQRGTGKAIRGRADNQEERQPIYYRI